MSEKNDEELHYSEDENDVDDTGSAVKQSGNYAGVHITNFKDMVLRPELLTAISECGFENPSEVQHQCIPPALLGRDIICQAKSGMGKTAVFVLATLHLVNPAFANQVQVIVLCHARELAYQIHREYARFGKHLPSIKTDVFLGGYPIDQQVKSLERCIPTVVVGTPGRINDLVQRKKLDLSKVKFFVVDECDRVLTELSMRRDVQSIYKMTPADRQVMMFSATLNKDVRKTCEMFCRNPEEVFVDDDAKLILHGLKQYYVNLEEKEKNDKLFSLLDVLSFNQVIIFVSKVRRATQLSALLAEYGFPSNFIHSKMKQEDRIQRFESFKKNDFRVLVTTDLFGRGIDVEHVNVVVNYDFPDSSDQYLHRVARAGRFGTNGLAISFVQSEEDKKVLGEVQARFTMEIPVLPDEIDSSSYTV